MKLAIFGFVLILLLAGCSGNTAAEVTTEPLPAGDASRGAEVFNAGINGAPACATCHRLTEETLVGPGLLGIGERAASRVAGESAEDYLLNSIIHPNAFLVENFANVMYPNYSVKLDAQQLADLIAFLLSQ